MTELLEPFNLLLILATGLLAGTMGGLLGVGGSTIMIPGLTLVLGYQQHLYQAAAMIANIAVSIPAVLRHRRAGVLVPQALAWMMPAALALVLIGVWVSNWPIFRGTDGGLWLGRVLAGFLAYVALVNILRLSGAAEHREQNTEPRITAPRSVAAGSVMGWFAGLLGIGGGAVAVPLQQVLLKLPLRQSIANSSAVICVSAGVGSIYKTASLGQHGQSPWEGLLLAALLAPTCWVGGQLGASLMHRLPIRPIRIAFIALMILSAWKMAAV